MILKISIKFQDSNDRGEFEFIMISEKNFKNLKPLRKIPTEIEEQVYEEVEGYESFNSKLQTRTTAFSCNDDDEEYGEESLISRPLPWVVRVFFKIKNSMKGILCSGKWYKVDFSPCFSVSRHDASVRSPESGPLIFTANIFLI